MDDEFPSPTGKVFKINNEKEQPFLSDFRVAFNYCIVG